MSVRDDPGATGLIRPMLATAGGLPERDAGWAYEMKWDGLRAIASIDREAVILRSRTGRNITANYPELAALGTAVGGGTVVLDGEIVAFGADGWPNFEALQQRMNLSSPDQVRQRAAETPVTYVAFDLLMSDGQSLLNEPYAQRRQRLDELGFNGPHWQTPPAFTDVAGGDLLAVSQQHGLEGIVAKRLASRYEPGKRSPSWLKIKNVGRQEFVVGGWKPGEGARTEQIGSLLIGVYEPEGLTYVGHVGTGFSQQTLRMLAARLAPLRRPTSPFGSTVPAEHARAAVWLEPLLVIDVEYAGWTNAGRLRAPSYMGVRDDKDPAEVVREG